MRVLARLVEGPATNGELLQPSCGGNRFGARLKEIRDAGIFIACDRIGAGKTRYGIAMAYIRPARSLLALLRDNE